jgi:hypothetical protein
MAKKYQLRVLGKRTKAGGTVSFSVEVETDASVAGSTNATKEMFKRLVDSQHPEVYKEKGVDTIDIISW